MEESCYFFIEVHYDPGKALCDGNQSLSPTAFAELMADLNKIAQAVGRTILLPQPSVL